jgi:hypothetical protein
LRHPALPPRLSQHIAQSIVQVQRFCPISRARASFRWGVKSSQNIGQNWGGNSGKRMTRGAYGVGGVPRMWKTNQ